MLLILTHENADFDAVASQVAASKLYPEGLPLLSWRVNRNVNQYLTLYWDAFSLARPDDWKRQRVSRVVLVDTSSLPSVRGIRSDKVQVQVIDHHVETETDRVSWTYHREQVGATTTILVEMLRLASNEATLLLLGIHEDTGSLVYDSTTARDAQAASWLMEQGAQLTIVRRFLNVPLSEQQQLLYELLLQSVEWIRIEGQSIIISAVVAPADFEDEISAVAHRLRDTLMPDAMFILVQITDRHVQLVARSTTDKIDVASVAQSVGGGGHERAAAATIMDQDLVHAKARLSDLIPSAVEPLTKVAKIMSYGVQMISADATVEEAAIQMQRSGHEGYPVTDASGLELRGLLTRRIVDRTLSHKLGHIPVERVMKLGNVTVQPSDSVEHVQKLMIEEGWGQIPVVIGQESPDNASRIIGIVTRTDLINLVTSADSSGDVPDMKKLMASSLPAALWDMVNEISFLSNSLEMPIYFVGGFVRDLLLTKRPKDIDIVVEGDAIELVRELCARFGGDSRSHAQFGTAKWIISRDVWQNVAKNDLVDSLPTSLDFVTARSEFYTEPTALPEVERASIKLDLHRRDFTINTLAIRLDGAHLGELLDFYGGQKDLDRGIIRVLHSLSFVDDPTRILRAVRLEQRLEFTINPRTNELLEAALAMLDRVSGDRIRNELELCLLESSRLKCMDRLAEMGVLAQIYPGLNWTIQTARCFKRVEGLLNESIWNQVRLEGSDSFVYFALLLLPLSTTVQHEAMERLKVRKSTRDDVIEVRETLNALALLPMKAAPSQVVMTLRTHSDRVLIAALAVAGSDSAAGWQIAQYQREWRHVRTITTGHDLLELGLEPGPQIGELLEQLLFARLDGKLLDEADERAILAKALGH
jgi:tRNA nucleotidyltransferase (CCA-adding enzyme)